MVVEACNRTMEAIHKPSFQYADRILEEWHKNGIRTLEGHIWGGQQEEEAGFRGAEAEKQQSVPQF